MARIIGVEVPPNKRIDIALRECVAFGAQQDETRARIGELRRDPVGVVALLGVAVEQEAGEYVFRKTGWRTHDLGSTARRDARGLRATF